MKKSEKQKAKALYLKKDLNQKEIAQKVGVTEKTLCKWAKHWIAENPDLSKTVSICIKRIYAELENPKSNIADIKTLTHTLGVLQKAAMNPKSPLYLQ